jgi:hypothetical protein
MRRVVSQKLTDVSEVHIVSTSEIPYNFYEIAQRNISEESYLHEENHMAGSLFIFEDFFFLLQLFVIMRTCSYWICYVLAEVQWIKRNVSCRRCHSETRYIFS